MPKERGVVGRASFSAVLLLVAAGCGSRHTTPLPPSGPVTWREAQRLILDCHIENGEVLHSRRLTLVLENGARVTTRVPASDNVFRVLRKADPHCPGPKTFAEE